MLCLAAILLVLSNDKFICVFIFFCSHIGSLVNNIVTAEMDLTQFRVLFERIASSPYFSRLLKSCPEFEQSYQCFLDCQGRLVSL